jgi:membrane protein DedA with SNARE-associated domain
MASEPSFLILLTIFAGAFFDTLIFTCVLVWGEVFFIMAGSLAHEHRTVTPLIAALSGAYASDQVGYLIGKFARRPFRRWSLNTRWRRKTYRKVADRLHRQTHIFLPLSRVLGPFAWVTPSVAGALRVPYPRFAIFSAIGVSIGVGMFLLMGWLIAEGARVVRFDLGAWMSDHAWEAMLVGNLLAVIGLIVWRNVSRSREKARKPPQ